MWGGDLTHRSKLPSYGGADSTGYGPSSYLPPNYSMPAGAYNGGGDALPSQSQAGPSQGPSSSGGGLVLHHAPSFVGRLTVDVTRYPSQCDLMWCADRD